MWVRRPLDDNILQTSDKCDEHNLQFVFTPSRPDTVLESRLVFTCLPFMDPLATQHVLISGTRIAYGVRGEGNPIVLVHGTPSSSLIWRNVVPRLTSAGYRVHVFDLLGYSLSERPWDPSIDTSISGQVPILEALFRHWGLEKAHVVAHDIGGGIAQRLAVFSPHLFRSLTLIDVVSFDSYPSKRTREQMQKGLETLIKAPDKEHRDHFRDWLLSAVHNKDRFIDASLETFLGYISGPVGQASLFQHQDPALRSQAHYGDCRQALGGWKEYVGAAHMGCAGPVAGDRLGTQAAGGDPGISAPYSGQLRALLSRR